MDIQSTAVGDLDVVALSGEFDSGNAAQFDAEVERLIGDYRIQLVVDLTRVTFLDSSGITRLIRTQRRLRPLGGQQVIVGANAVVQSTLKTVGIDCLIRMLPDVAEAQTYFTDPERARDIDLKGVPVDEALLGRIDVAFGLANDREATATGKLLATYDDGLLIRCTAAASRDAFNRSELEVGDRLWVRFHQPMLARGHEFKMEADIVFAYDEGDDSKYRLRFTKIDERDAELMREFALAQDDMRTYGQPLGSA